jgi:hypothetical protein
MVQPYLVVAEFGRKMQGYAQDLESLKSDED